MMKPRSLPLALVASLFLVFAVQAQIAPTVERTAPGRIAIHWQGADPVDVYLADQPDAPIAKATRVAQADKDGAFTATWAQAARPYVILKDDRDGHVARVAERLLSLQQGSNFRDLGGYPAAGGKHVRWGMIYRTAATPMLTDADSRYVESLGIGANIDLRSVEERELAPDDAVLRTHARYFAKDYPASDVFSRLAPPPAGAKPAAGGQSSLYRGWLVSLAPQYRQIFLELLADKGAVTYHCSAGQDRTGVASALVLSALGVPRDVILADYHLSTADRRPQYEMPPVDPAQHPGNIVAAYYAKARAAGPAMPKPLDDAQGVAFLQQTFDEIDSRWGSVDAYLDKQLGIGPRDIARLRTLYLE